MTAFLIRAVGSGSMRSLLAAAAIACLRTMRWAVVTTLLILRPVIAMLLLPLGMMLVLLAVLIGFWAEARPIAEHRWALLGIGLGSIALIQLYDALIGVLAALPLAHGSVHR